MRAPQKIKNSSHVIQQPTPGHMPKGTISTSEVSALPCSVQHQARHGKELSVSRWTGEEAAMCMHRRMQAASGRGSPFTQHWRSRKTPGWWSVRKAQAAGSYLRVNLSCCAHSSTGRVPRGGDGAGTGQDGALLVPGNRASVMHA